VSYTVCARQARNYDKVTDPSMLRFLVDLRGEDVSNKQVSDKECYIHIGNKQNSARKWS
jgi:cytochrome P450 family 97 subfamily B polypeptide 3